MMDRKYMMYMALGFEAAGLILAFLFLGNYIDERYHLRGLGLAGGVLFGMTLWIIHAIMLFRTLEKREESSKTPPE